LNKIQWLLLFFLICAGVILFNNRLRPSQDTDHQWYESFYTDTIDDSSITILNWNIHKEVDNALWVTDFQSILGTYSPDIITLQEARSTASFKNALGEDRGYIFAPNIRDGNGNSSGVLTASQAEPSNFLYKLSENYEPILNTPKIILTTTYELRPSMKELQVINVHGINFVSLEKFNDQMIQIEESIKSHIGPQLIIGDFNTWKETRMSILFSIAERHSLSQVAFSSTDSSEVKHFMNSPLDHIFYSNDLRLHTNSSNVLEEILSSDHKPLVATFSLENRTI